MPVPMQVPMAALYLVAWQDTDKAAVLPPVVVELCQAVRWQRYEMYKKINGLEREEEK